jgi:fused signal recognition particle receptor
MSPETLNTIEIIGGFAVLLILFIIGLVAINKKAKKAEDLLRATKESEVTKTAAIETPQLESLPKIKLVPEPKLGADTKSTSEAKPSVELKPKAETKAPVELKVVGEAKQNVETKIVPEAKVNLDFKANLEVVAVTDLKSPKEFKSAVEVKPAVEAEKATSIFDALSATRKNIWGRISAVLGGSQISNLDDIEEILYTSDLGPQTVQRLLTKVTENLSRSEKKDSEIVRTALKEEMLSMFTQVLGETATSINNAVAIEKSDSLELFEKFKFGSPAVWMIVGVNGAGKTTTIGKIAAQLARSGKKVLVAAGDTFRAAAGSQLQVWTERAQVEIFSPAGITDPSAVAFDAVNSGKAKGYDVIIVDTAGRLHTQQNLMEEIKKMKRVVQKVVPDGPHEILLVLDANQGQNALMQAKEFHKALDVTGVVLTKMDGTAKGGVAVGVTHELQLPIKLIGVGEKIEDLQKFSAKTFVDSIL